MAFYKLVNAVKMLLEFHSFSFVLSSLAVVPRNAHACEGRPCGLRTPRTQAETDVNIIENESLMFDNEIFFEEGNLQVVLDGDEENDFVRAPERFASKNVVERCSRWIVRILRIQSPTC